MSKRKIVAKMTIGRALKLMMKGLDENNVAAFAPAETQTVIREAGLNGECRYDYYQAAKDLVGTIASSPDLTPLIGVCCIVGATIKPFKLELSGDQNEVNVKLLLERGVLVITDLTPDEAEEILQPLQRIHDAAARRSRSAHNLIWDAAADAVIDRGCPLRRIYKAAVGTAAREEFNITEATMRIAIHEAELIAGELLAAKRKAKRAAERATKRRAA